MFKLVDENTVNIVNGQNDFRESLDFPTFEKVSLFDANGNELPNYKGIANTETGEIVNVPKKGYEVFNHDKAFDIIDQSAMNLFKQYGKDYVKPEIDLSGNGGNLKVTYNLPECFNIDVGEGDNLQTRLVAYNSVDGSKCLSFHIDFLRLICTNGMKGFSRDFSFSRKHTSRVHHDAQTAQLEKQINTAWVAVRENAEMLKNNAVDYHTGMDVIKAMVDKKLFPQKMKHWIEDEWSKYSKGTHRNQLERNANLWGLYNAVTNAVSHSTNKKGDNISNDMQEVYQGKLNKFILKLTA